jgi:hypothetical protein
MQNPSADVAARVFCSAKPSIVVTLIFVSDSFVIPQRSDSKAAQNEQHQICAIF